MPIGPLNFGMGGWGQDFERVEKKKKKVFYFKFFEENGRNLFKKKV